MTGRLSIDAVRRWGGRGSLTAFPHPEKGVFGRASQDEGGQERASSA
jgi:hypothetical protein